MKLNKIIFSPTGGTKKVCDILSNEFHLESNEINLMKETSYTEINSNDLSIVAVPSFSGRVPALAVQRLNKIHGNGSKCILVVVYGNREIDDTLIELKDVMTSLGFKCIAGIKAVANHSIFRDFAKGRPDADDEIELKQFALEIKNNLDTLEECNVPGNRPYKVVNGNPFKPTANSDCNECGLCAKSCPVHAIDFTDLKNVNKEVCISCMHCISICPTNARQLNKLAVETAQFTMKSKFEGRKENKLYLK